MAPAACFSNPNTASSPQYQTPHNLITCTYQTALCEDSSSHAHLTLAWSNSPASHTLTLFAADSFSATLSLRPSRLSLFRTRPGSGSRSIRLPGPASRKIKLHWDFTRARFPHASAEPDSGFYLAITRNARVEFFLGDLRDEFARRVGPRVDSPHPAQTLLSRREHAFGRRSYLTRAEFSGSKHEIGIECGGGALKVKVDGEVKLVVKRLAWKFRGNERMVVGGVEVEFFWDVFNWVNRSNSGVNGVFVFQVGDGGVWPEMVGPEKKLMRKSLSAPATLAAIAASPSPSSSSVLQWAEESSDGGRSSSSSSTRSSGSNAGGFSLLLYAWKRD